MQHRQDDYVVIAQPKWTGWVEVEWDVAPSWGDLLTFARWTRERTLEFDAEVAAMDEAEKQQQAEIARAFLADANARAQSIEEDSVTIDGCDFWGRRSR